MGYLAAAQAREGAIVDALETVEEALQANPDELVYRPGILRLRGELRLEHGQAETAEAGFREAIALARSLGAKAWELRATMSLARVLAKQARRDEARSMLAEIYVASPKASTLATSMTPRRCSRSWAPSPPLSPIVEARLSPPSDEESGVWRSRLFSPLWFQRGAIRIRMRRVSLFDAATARCLNVRSPAAT
jgi:hypothetical protein